jgi:hypothetical protein
MRSLHEGVRGKARGLGVGWIAMDKHGRESAIHQKGDLPGEAFRLGITGRCEPACKPGLKLFIMRRAGAHSGVARHIGEIRRSV